MKRHGFKMKLKPGHQAEYKRRHDEIWPELVTLLSEHGLCDYHIFHDPETDILFAVQHLREGAKPDALPDHPVMRKWWAHMADVMETDAAGVPIVKPIVEVFHMD